MKRRVLMVMAAMTVLLAAMGCQKTTTSSVTDADGNTTTTTTVTDSTGTATTTQTTNSDGEVTSHTEDGNTTASIHFENICGVDFYELYISSNDSDDWGENIISEENAPLADGESLNWNDAFTYNDDYLVWDLLAVDSEGTEVSFSGLDISGVSNPGDLTFTFEYSDEDGFTASVQ